MCTAQIDADSSLSCFLSSLLPFQATIPKAVPSAEVGVEFSEAQTEALLRWSFLSAIARLLTEYLDHRAPFEIRVLQR